jgi:uncharacterized protein involved in exopolysaccharide biosynthesis
MERYLETFFRHPLALVAPVLMVLAISLGFVLGQPRTYEASASVWFQSNSIAGVTDPSAAYSSPAQVGSNTFQELLSTQSFCVTVAQRSGLEDYVVHGHLPATNPLSAVLGRLLGPGSAPNRQTLNQALEALLQRNVRVTTAGPEIVNVTFEYSDPRLALSTLRELLKEFATQVLTAQRTQAAQQLDSYQRQAADELTQVNQADAAVASYLARHPELRVANPPPDPTLAGLQQIASQAHQQYAQLIQKRDEAQSNLNQLSVGTSSQFRVIDPPMLPDRPLSRLRTVAMGAGLGLLIGLLLSLLALVIMVYSDRTFVRPAEIERSLGLRVIGALPLLDAPDPARAERAPTALPPGTGHTT